MLLGYVLRLRNELGAILKLHYPDSWNAILELPQSDQPLAIAQHPSIRECISYHLLSQAGFGPDAYVQHRGTREVFVVTYAIISPDVDGNPLDILLYGKPEHAPANTSPGLIGRLEMFVSMASGVNILPPDLFKQIPVEERGC